MYGSFELGDGPGRALLIHGFTGTPWEMRPIAERLAARGYRVRAPLLAGHGTSPRDLERTSWPDWFATVERAAEELGEGGPVMVCGLSLGGLLALHLAHESPEQVAALATLAAAIRLRQPIGAGVRLRRALRRTPLAPLVRRLRAVRKTVGSDVADRDLRWANPGYQEVPLDPLSSLVEFGAIVRRELASIRVPTLVLHGRLDHTVPYESAHELCEALGAREIRHVPLERSFHQLGVDIERGLVADETAAWFDRHGGARSPDSAGAVLPE